MNEIVEERVRPPDTTVGIPRTPPRRSWLYRRFAARILGINDTPEAVARGVSVGALIAMTPTVGLQMLMVLVIHTLARANRLAGIIMVYLSNPFTLIPIYWLDYAAGSLLLGKRLLTYEEFTVRIGAATDLMGKWEFWGATRKLVALGADFAVPMFLGGIVLGLVLAIPLYPITLAAVRRHRARRPRARDDEVCEGETGAIE